MNAPAPSPVSLQLDELVLKTGRFDEMRAWYTHLLGRKPFYEHVPDPEAPPRPEGMPERAVDVRVAFFLIHENPYPHPQILGLFGIDSLCGATPSGSGLHHFQFGVSSLGDLVGQYEHMLQIGAIAHRAANHGQATSYYFRDPDANIVEFSCKNVDSLDDEMSFMSSAAFAANPSGLELDPAEFARRYHNGEPYEQLLSLDGPPR